MGEFATFGALCDDAGAVEAVVGTASALRLVTSIPHVLSAACGHAAFVARTSGDSGLTAAIIASADAVGAIASDAGTLAAAVSCGTADAAWADDAAYRAMAAGSADAASRTACSLAGIDPLTADCLAADPASAVAVLESDAAHVAARNSGVMGKVAASAEAMAAVAASSDAMGALAASPVALAAVARSEAARSAWMGSEFAHVHYDRALASLGNSRGFFALTADHIDSAYEPNIDGHSGAYTTSENDLGISFKSLSKGSDGRYLLDHSWAVPHDAVVMLADGISSGSRYSSDPTAWLGHFGSSQTREDVVLSDGGTKMKDATKKMFVGGMSYWSGYNAGGAYELNAKFAVYSAI